MTFDNSIIIFHLGVTCELFDLLQIFLLFSPTDSCCYTNQEAVTSRIVARSFSDMGRPGRDVGAKGKIYLNIADDAM